MATRDLFGNLIADAFTRSLTGGKPVAHDYRTAIDGAGKLVRVIRAPHATPEEIVPVYVGRGSPAFIGPIERHEPGVRSFGADHSTDRAFVARARHDATYLTRKAARAIPMMEGQREYYGEPDRVRVGALQRQVQIETKQRGA